MIKDGERALFYFKRVSKRPRERDSDGFRFSHSCEYLGLLLGSGWGGLDHLYQDSNQRKNLYGLDQIGLGQNSINLDLIQKMK